MERNYLNLDVGLDGNPALMTHGGQTRQEASRLMTSFLTPKHITAFGTWNVCTMYQTGKSAQVANEMRRYGLKLLGISEVRWLGSGSTTLLTGEEVLYSGREEGEEHTEGVGEGHKEDPTIMGASIIKDHHSTVSVYSKKHHSD